MELCCDKFRDSLDLGEEVKHDDGCPIPRRIGGNKGPGGCDSYIIDIVPEPISHAPQHE